jgi:hypothetical protein
MRPQFKDLTAQQKTVALELLKKVFPILDGETDAAYLTRLAQELLYAKAFQLFRAKKEQEIRAIDTIQ